MAFSRDRIEKEGKQVEVLYPLHEVDSYNGEELRHYVSSMEEKIDYVIINFSKVSYLNSSGLRELIQILKYLKENDSVLYLTAISVELRKIFDNTNLNRLFNIQGSNEEAIEDID